MKVDMSPSASVFSMLLSQLQENDKIINSSIDTFNRKATPLTELMERTFNILNLKGKKVRFIENYQAGETSRMFPKGVTAKITEVYDKKDVSIIIGGKYEANWIPVEVLEVIR